MSISKVNSSTCSLFVVLPVFCLSSPSFAHTTTWKMKREITHQAQKMTRCWNRQDLKCVIMNFYTRHAIYPTTKGPLVGRKQIYDSFAKRFYNVKRHKIVLGKLSFSLSNFHVLGPFAVLNILYYKLWLNHKMSTGYSVLTWKKVKHHWKILSDQPRATYTR